MNCIYHTLQVHISLFKSPVPDKTLLSIGLCSDTSKQLMNLKASRHSFIYLWLYLNMVT